MVDADIPLLLGLDVMDNERLVPNNITSTSGTYLSAASSDIFTWNGERKKHYSPKAIYSSYSSISITQQMGNSGISSNVLARTKPMRVPKNYSRTLLELEKPVKYSLSHQNASPYHYHLTDCIQSWNSPSFNASRKQGSVACSAYWYPL